ncbi:MAG: hypothetical protein ACLQLT_11815, partial [Methylovirgula sp.]
MSFSKNREPLFGIMLAGTAIAPPLGKAAMSGGRVGHPTIHSGQRGSDMSELSKKVQEVFNEPACDKNLKKSDKE